MVVAVRLQVSGRLQRRVGQKLKAMPERQLVVAAMAVRLPNSDGHAKPVDGGC